MNKAPEFVEQVYEAPADPDTCLTDDQLYAGGLLKVRAFMRTKATDNALRLRRHKVKTEAMGIRQINVQAPEDAHKVIKRIAERTKSGENLAEVLNSISVELNAPSDRVAHEDNVLIEIGRKANALTGWKKSLAKLVGIL